jgi:hypothetical protein
MSFCLLTYSISEWATQASGPPHYTFTIFTLQHAMNSPHCDEALQKEGRILLAIRSIENNQIQSVRRAATVYNVPRNTLHRRLNNILSRRDCTPNSMKLDKLEETAIIQYVLDLDSRGFSPRLCFVRDMADKLRSARSRSPVGKNWADNFVNRTPGLKMRFRRKYDRQRALNEDPEVIQKWFELVRNTIAKHGICEDDIYNFDETGFQMGVISSGKVVTGSERRSAPKAIQPGNREWVTVIQGVNAKGWALPPYIIFAGENHLQAWYEELLPPNWVLSVSEKGWTNNEIGLDWIQHFNLHTKDRSTGVKRLLIIDGHESHDSLQFREFCAENHIITLCMPPHSSHLLQPLDVACFSPLKRAYGNEIEQLVRCHINHITKLEFLPAFRAAFARSFNESNIKAGFRATGLVPHDPEVVITQLDVRLTTPTPPPEADVWRPQTPSNAIQVDQQTRLIQDRILNHPDSSPTTLLSALDQLAKGTQLIAHSATLIRAHTVAIEKANEALSRRKRRSKKRIQQRGSLSIQDGQFLIDQSALNYQISQETRSRSSRVGTRAGETRRCGHCRQPGHRIQTCPERLVNTQN